MGMAGIYIYIYNFSVMASPVGEGQWDMSYMWVRCGTVR